MSDALPTDALSGDILRHGRFVRAVAQGLVAPDAADDVVQETWLAALDKPPRPGRGLRAWLGRVARNAALKTLRGDGRRLARETAAARPERAPDGATLAERERRVRAVFDATARLDEPSRLVVMLRYYDGLEPAEIAARLGVPGATVRSRLRRALEKLREDLDAEYGSRATWTAALLPLAHGGFVPVVATTGAAAAAAATAVAAPGIAGAWFGGLLMAKKSLVVGCLAAALVATAVVVLNQGADPPAPPATLLKGRDASELAPAVAPEAPAATSLASTPFRPDRDVGDDEDFARDGAPRGTASLRLMGRVVDEAGRPVAAAAVRVRGGATSDFPSGDFGVRVSAEPPAEAVTGADGRFALSVVGGGEGTVRARPVDLVDAVRRVKLPRSGELDLGDLVARRGATVEGMVRDEDGRGVPGAFVAARTIDAGNDGSRGLFVFGGMGGRDDEIRQTVADASGRYALKGLAEGEGRVEAWTEDRPEAKRAGLALAAGVVLRDVDLTLKTGKTLEGVVRDARGDPVAGARVRVDPEMTHMGPGGGIGARGGRRLTTDEQGRFTARGFDEGRQRVTARKQGFRPATVVVAAGAEPATLKLAASSVVFGRVVGPDGKPPASFTATVRRASGGAYWPGAGLGGAKVAYGAEAARALGESDPAGLWLASDVPYEAADVVVKAAGAAEETREAVALESGGKARVDMALKPERLVRGVVHDPAGAPIGGARVTVATWADPREDGEIEVGGVRRTMAVRAGSVGAAAEGRVVFNGVTAADGTFVAGGLTDGAYSVDASHEEHLAAPRAKAEVSATAPAAEVRLGLKAAGILAGRAYDADGAPLKGASVEIMLGAGTPGWGPSVLTDQDGRFEKRGLEPGDYVARIARRRSGPEMVFASVQIDGEEPAPRTLEAGEVAANVRSGERTEIELREPRPASVSGTVTDGGRPAAGVQVRLEKETAGFAFLGGGGPSILTDAHGAFTFRDRAAGKYKIVVDPEGCPIPVERPVVLEAGKDLREDVALPTAAIEGRVVDGTGAPVVGASVTATREDAEEGEGGRRGRGAVIAVSAIASGGPDDDDMADSVMSFGVGRDRARIKTDAEGRYRLKYLAAGSYGVSAEGAGIVPASTKGVAVAEGATTRGVDLIAEAAGSIETTVDVGGSGAPYVMLEFTPVAGGDPRHSGCEPGKPSTETGFKAGKWRVRATHAEDPERSAETIVEVRAGSTAKAPLRL